MVMLQFFVISTNELSLVEEVYITTLFKTSIDNKSQLNGLANGNVSSDTNARFSQPPPTSTKSIVL